MPDTNQPPINPLNPVSEPEQTTPTVNLPPINSKNQLATSILTTAVNKGWVNTSNLFIQVLFVLPAVVTSFMGQSDLEDKNRQLEIQNEKLGVLVEELKNQNKLMNQKSKELARQIGVSLNNVEGSLNVIASEGKKLQYRIKMLENHNKIEYPEHIRSMIEPEFNLSPPGHPRMPGSEPSPISLTSFTNILSDSNTLREVNKDEINVPIPSVDFDEE